MALIKQSASPYSLKYVVSEEEGIKSRADMVTDCAPGPLREKLRLALVWAGLDVGQEIGIYIHSGNAVPDAGSARFRTVGPNDTFEGFGSGVIEVRFHHSAVR
jgi:hypothetical protein